MSRGKNRGVLKSWKYNIIGYIWQNKQKKSPTLIPHHFLLHSGAYNREQPVKISFTAP